jgi:Protein of unknown function (DUF3987)
MTVGDDRRPTLDEAAFLGPAGEYAQHAAPFTEADPVAVLASSLTLAATAIGAGPYMLAGNDHHPARLFVNIIGETSKGGKGTSYAVSRELATRAFPELDRRVMSGFGSGERVVDMVKDPAKDHAGEPDKRLLVFEPEFSRFLRVAGRKESIHSAIIRDAWDGRRLETHSRSSGDVVATGHHINFLGHSTLPELNATLSHVDVYNGFANRFLWVVARRTQLLPDGGNVPERVINRFVPKIAHAVGLARRHGEVKRTEAGEQRWQELYYDLAADEPDGLLGAATSRDAPQCLRLSLLYCLLDESDAVDDRHIDAAAAFWAYARASAQLVFGDTLGDPNADRLLAALVNAGPAGLDGAQQHAIFDNHISAAELERARRLLEDKRKAVTHSEKTGGRERLITVAARFTSAN